eukprot:scaffold10544_cov105-Isochrysis_galbana.AAC.2
MWHARTLRRGGPGAAGGGSVRMRAGRGPRAACPTTHAPTGIRTHTQPCTHAQTHHSAPVPPHPPLDPRA